ncbi:hypothetical protein C8F04DRAFT_1242373 [Mycena alexandri]|uniref:Uncharacterized protein n=1 Tax=Mycena alexandri TaxID=1745969 RepID=A0AAD6WMJ5_9AGAR|nr:hypothetical protein C8F04DRAFT_1242373 [Mycena alexandri]
MESYQTHELSRIPIKVTKFHNDRQDAQATETSLKLNPQNEEPEDGGTVDSSCRNWTPSLKKLAFSSHHSMTTDRTNFTLFSLRTLVSARPNLRVNDFEEMVPAAARKHHHPTRAFIHNRPFHSPELDVHPPRRLGHRRSIREALAKALDAGATADDDVTPRPKTFPALYHLGYLAQDSTYNTDSGRNARRHEYDDERAPSAARISSTSLRERNAELCLRGGR